MRENWAKKKHHDMNKGMRIMNKNLLEDPDIKGRYQLREVALSKLYYETTEGGTLFVRYEIYDVLTGVKKAFVVTDADYGFGIIKNVSSFIKENLKLNG